MPALRLWPRWGLFCLGTLLLAACGREGVRAAPAAADEKTAQITVWSDRFELFLEHRLLVVQIPTTFITHVTDPPRSHPVGRDR